MVDKHRMAKETCKIIAQEFIKRNMYGVCLPASLLVFELLKDLGATLKCGKLSYQNKITAPMHFWIELDDIIYDPTIEIICHHWNTIMKTSLLEMNNFKHHWGLVTVQDFEDDFMIHAYYFAKISGDVHPYFQLAPSIMRKVRYEVKCKFIDLGE